MPACIGVMAVVLVSLIGAAQPPPTPLLVTDDESYAVYAEAIGRTAANTPLLLSQETTTRQSFPDCDITGRWQPEWKPVVADFIEANSTRHLLLPNRPLGRAYSLFRWADFYKRFPTLKEYDWREFYSVYGMDFGGLWTVSAVGFDATKRRAVVYVEQARGPRGTRGETHFLEKPGIDWREADWRDVGEYIRVCNWVE
jgi:hypothetical protein